MNRDRGFRLHQYALRKERVRRRIRAQWYYAEMADEPKMVARLADTRSPCSCLMCGNRRKSEGPTLAERRAALECAG